MSTLKMLGQKNLLRSSLLLSTLIFSTPLLAGGYDNDECRGNQNCDDVSVEVNVETDNTNTVTATGGDGGESTAESTATSTSNSGGNELTVNQTDVRPSSIKIRNVASPDTPNPYPTAPCRIGKSAGLSLAGGSVSGGASSEDPECTLRETVRLLHTLGYTEIGMQLLCTQSVVIVGRKDKKGNLAKNAPTPLGASECLRLVGEVARQVDESDEAADSESAGDLHREEHDRADARLAARLDRVEQTLSEQTANQRRIARSVSERPPVVEQVVQQPRLSASQKSRLEALFTEEEETEQ